MKHILFLTPELPWPMSSGGRIKSARLVEHLQTHYQMDIGCLLKGDDTDNLASFISARNPGVVIAERHNAGRSAVNMARSLLKGVPLNVFRSRNEGLARRLDEVIHNYDAVFVDHYEMMQYIPDDLDCPLILHQHNAYYVLWERYAKHGSGIVPRLAAWIESRRVKKYEAGVCARADLVFAAPNDIDKLVEAGVEEDRFAPTMHLGDDSQLGMPDLEWKSTTPSLLYVGHLSWEPNIQGLLWFLDHCWPSIKSFFPGLQFNIVGGRPDQRLVDKTRGDEQVALQGFQEDLEPWIQKSHLFVAPLLIGSGIKVKVINALTRGIPTVTTPVGAEGLGATHLRELAIANSAEEMSELVTLLLKNRFLWERLASQSRVLAREKFTWQSVLGDMQRHIDCLLESGSESILLQAA